MGSVNRGLQPKGEDHPAGVAGSSFDNPPRPSRRFA